MSKNLSYNYGEFEIKNEFQTNISEISISDIDNWYDEILKELSSSNESSTNYVKDENQINNERLIYLEENITPFLLSLFRNEDYESGQKCESIRLVEEQLKINKVATQNWFNKLYLKYFTSDEKTLLNLLRIVEYIDRDLLYPTGQTMALASLTHKNDEIKEMSVMFFESWVSIESYNILKNVSVETKWLQDYIDHVKLDLKEELCLY